MSYDQFADTGRAHSLSPLDLKGRILVKGKVKPSKAKSAKKLAAEEVTLAQGRRTALSRLMPTRLTGRLGVRDGSGTELNFMSSFKKAPSCAPVRPFL